MVNSFFYNTLDVFFNILHIIIILINCFGWAFKKTLMLNLILLLTTMLSWTILGVFFGLGFCFLTNLHFALLGELKPTNIPFSYLDYLLIENFNLKVSSQTISLLSILVVFGSLGISIKKNFCLINNYLLALLIFCCINWILIIYKNGIGFIPSIDQPYIALSLFATIILTIEIILNLFGKKFLKMIT